MKKSLKEMTERDAGERYGKLNKDVTDWKKIRPIQLFVPRTFQNEFKILQLAISKKKPISRIEISYNGSWRPLCDLQLSKPIVKQDPKPEQPIIDNGTRFQPGFEFTGSKNCFQGIIKVIKVDGNDLFVELKQGASVWNETWNLEHTESGFKRGDYF